MSVLNLQIQERVLGADQLKPIFSGAQNVDTIKVTFDSEWSGYRKTAVFSRDGDDCYFVDLDSSGSAKIPSVVLEEAGTILIGIMAESGDQRITSSLVKYRVGEGASVSELLDPSAMRSLMDLLNRALTGEGGVTGLRDGTTFTPSVSSDGVLSWTNDGSLANPTPVSIKGPEGIGVKSVTAWFGRSASSTTGPSGYNTAPPMLTPTYKYLWSYWEITLTNDQKLRTKSTLTGAHGDTGPKGSPGTTPSITASKSGNTTTLSVSDDDGTRQLAQILDGADGVSVSSLTLYYLRSNSASGVTTSTSGWQATLPSLTSSYNYLWTYFKVELSDGTGINSAPLIIGNYNSRLSSVSVYYLPSSSSSTPSTTAAGWTTTYSTPTAEKPYLWCHLRFFYYAYGSSSTHAVYSSVFRLAVYQSSSAASGVVLDYSNPQNINDTTMGDAGLAAIQCGIMPVIYSGNRYMQVLKAEPVSYCGINYIRLFYMMESCSNLILTSVDWQTSS